MVPKTYARPSLDDRRIGELVDLISSTWGRTSWAVSTALPRLVRLRTGQARRGEFDTHQSVDKLLVEMLEPMNRRVYDECCGSGALACRPSGSSKSTAASAELLPTPGSSPAHLSQQLRVLRRAGFPQQQTGTTVTYTLSDPLVVDLLTVARSRLYEVVNNRMESLTELPTDFADR